LRDIQVELIDRFGLLPQPTKNLFMQTEIRLQAEPMGITKIDLNENGGKVNFNDKPDINTEELILMLQKTPNIYRLNGQHTLRCMTKMEKEEQRFEFAVFLLNRLTNKE
jgi:transcription-repair coupling factor (superfamily II helicase)